MESGEPGSIERPPSGQGSLLNLNERGGWLESLQALDLGNSSRIGLVESEVLNLNAREWAVRVAARIYPDAPALYVNAELALTSVARQVLCWGVPEEAALAFVVLVEVQVAGPEQYIRIRFSGRRAENQSRMDINGLGILMIKREASHELQMVFRNVNVGDVFQIHKLHSISRQGREPAVLRNQPLIFSVVETVKQHLLMISAQHDDIRILP